MQVERDIYQRQWRYVPGFLQVDLFIFLVFIDVLLMVVWSHVGYVKDFQRAVW